MNPNDSTKWDCTNPFLRSNIDNSSGSHNVPAVVAMVTIPLPTRWRSYGRNVYDQLRKAIIFFVIKHWRVVHSTTHLSRHSLSVFTGCSCVFRVLPRCGTLKWRTGCLSFTICRLCFQCRTVLCVRKRVSGTQCVVHGLRHRPFAATTRHRRRTRRRRQFHSRRVRVALIGGRFTR